MSLLFRVVVVAIHSDSAFDTFGPMWENRDVATAKRSAMHQQQRDKLLTQKEAAAESGVNEKIIRAWVDVGSIKVVPLPDSKNWRILRSTLFENLKTLQISKNE